MTPITGRRIYPSEDGFLYFSPGDYGFDPNSGHWMGRPPYEGCSVGDFFKHEVKEHEDGTITVSPSILHNPPGQYHNPVVRTWHGFLEKGVWREC